MKKLIILFVFISSTCFSQDIIFNFQKAQLYKITMEGANDFNKADNIGRTMEKMQLAIFSYVDTTTSTGYFIVDNFYKVHEIEKAINNQSGYKYIGFEEMQLSETLFLEIYMKRGGFGTAEFSNQPPKKIQMGPFNELTNSLFNKANEIWDKKYKK